MFTKGHGLNAKKWQHLAWILYFSCSKLLSPSKLDNRSDNYEIQSLLGNGSSEGDSLIGQYRFNAKVHNQEFIGRYGFQNGIHEYDNRVSFWQRQI